MAAEESFFKFRGRNVQLDILEDWYQKQEVSGEDVVEIADNSDGPFVEYKLKTLISLYGPEFPFRRIRRERWDPCSSSSDSSSDGEFDVRPDSEPLFPSAPVNPAPIKIGGRFHYSSSSDSSSDEESGVRPYSEPFFPSAPVNPAPIKMGGRFPPPKSDIEKEKIAPKTAKPLATVAPLERESQKPSEEVEAPTVSVAPLKKANAPKTPIYADYPLFNLENEPLNDRITGADVQREMIELYELYNKFRDSNTFYEHNVCLRTFRFKAQKITCSLCQNSFDACSRFFTHLFSESHIRLLKNHHVSMCSFDFYRKHFEEKLHHFPFDFFPLLNPKTGCGSSQLPLGDIIDLFETIPKNHLDVGGRYMKRIFKTVPQPERCELCNLKLALSIKKRCLHIFSKTHLSKLKMLEGIDPREIYFWHNLLTIYREMSKMPIETQKILNYQNQIPVALVDFRIDALNFSSQTQRTEELKQLQEQWSTVPKDLFEKASFNEFQHNPKIRCWFCSFANFKSRVQLFEHIFTEKHLQYLTTFGYSQEALTAVKRKFEAVNESRKSPAPAVSATKAVPQSQAEGKNGRVPMLNAPPSKAISANQAQFVEALRLIETLLTKEVKAVAARKRGNYKCTYCPFNVTLKTELQVLEHILSQKHKEYMKFGSSLDDLDYWVKKVEAYKTSQVGEKKKEPEQNLNDPRVPLLDPATSKLVDERTFHSMMNKARTSFASGGKAVEQLVNRKFVTWKCSFCPNVKKLTTELMAFVHITCKNHCENTKRLSSLEDLEYWNKWVGNLLVEASKKTATSKDPVEINKVEPANQRPPLSTVNTSMPTQPKPPQTVESNTAVTSSCTAPQSNQRTRQRKETPVTSELIGLSMTKLPLFHIPPVTPSPRERFEHPTLHMMRTVALNILPENRTELSKKKAFTTTAICPFCHLDMTLFAYWQVIEHAFSVRHIHAASQYHQVGFSLDDYRFWLSFLTQSHRVIQDDLSREELRINTPVFITGTGFPVFSNFTPAEREMINKFNGPIEPAANRVFLIQSYAACYYCNEWTLEPVKIVKHELSDRHIEKVRKCHQVSQIIIDMFMGYVKRVQPSVFDKCNIM